MNRCCAAAAILCVSAALFLGLCQEMKRNRGEGWYYTMASNTTGRDNIWLTLRGIGFIWANKSLDSTNPNASENPGYFPFAEVSSEIGITNYASFLFESRFLSYTWNNWFQFGNIVAGIKFTRSDNKELRFHGFGLELKYIWNSTGIIFPSVAGYRVGATGFAPEGYIVEGGNAQFKLLYDIDFIKRFSRLPLKIGANAGMRLPLKKAEYVAKQYLFSTGILYSDLGFDVFAEYSLEAFNNIFRPKSFVNLPSNKKTELHFWENPMYVVLGGRIRYGNGVTLFACVPFLLSSNVGSAMTSKDKELLSHSTGPGAVFYDEHNRGLTDPFDPWFAKWKIIGEISLPVFYKQTGAEMMRNFLLLKNRTEKQKIDIDERLRRFETESDSLKANEVDRKKRLEEIQKRRDQPDTME
jgi:hypothetical protein